MGQISDLQLPSFWYILVGVVVVTGVKQSQLLDLCLGLGLEFDNSLADDLSSERLLILFKTGLDFKILSRPRSIPGLDRPSLECQDQDQASH